MPKKCDGCGEDFKGFGTTCGPCRMGTEKTVFNCQKCGATFNGKTNVCELCGGKALPVGKDGKLVRQSSLISAPVDPSDQNLCMKCQCPFGNQQSVIFENNRYHESCFVCDRCQKPLKPGECFKQEDKIICGSCLPANFCDGCSQKLTGTITKVNGKQYHPGCFKCDECAEPLVGGFAKAGDKCLCKACAQKKMAKGTCVKCDKPITGACIKADKGDLFHKECFKCFDCEQPLKSYVKDEGRKFKYQKAVYLCKPCAETRQKNEKQDEDFSPCQICGSQYPKGQFWCVKCQAPCYKVDESAKKCCICSEEVSGPDVYQLADFSVFHLGCFKCNKCDKQGLTQQDIKDGKLGMANTHVDACMRGEYACEECIVAAQTAEGS